MLRPWIGCLFCLGLAACAGVPQIDEAATTGDGQLPRIVGASGPLTARQSKALLDRLVAEGKASDLLERHLAVEQSVAETPLVAGNQVRLLENGPATFRALFAAIRGAKRHLNLEYFILQDIESDGQHLGDLLVEKRSQGVAVNIIYDSYGSLATPKAFFDRLKGAGVNLLSFNPLNPLAARTGYEPNDRDHRKILIVDGKLAMIGGVNLSTDYQSYPSMPLAARSEPPKVTWRDTDAEIEGPVVAQLQRLFVAHWQAQGGPPLDQTDFFPKLAPVGDEVVRIIGSTPRDGLPRYYVTLLSAIRTAEKRIWLTTAFFVPTHQEKEDLIDAALRGVDVRLLLPGQSESNLALAVQRSHYGDLLEAGVLIYETDNEILHSKTTVVDSVWSVVGSSNFDQRSVIFNDEVDGVFLGRATAQQLEALFLADTARAKQVQLGPWEDRPIGERLDELFARFWQSML
jgi:cardiolipin synthase A/B